MVIVSPTLDNDPVVLEFVYTHDSAASVYLNISTTISDTQLTIYIKCGFGCGELLAQPGRGNSEPRFCRMSQLG